MADFLTDVKTIRERARAEIEIDDRLRLVEIVEKAK